MGGRLALMLGEEVAHQVQQAQPDYISPEVLEQQATLRHFEDKFGLIGNLLVREGSGRVLKDRVARSAHALLEEGLVDEHTAIELRPVLPADALRDPVMNSRREEVLDMMRFRLSSEYDVTAIPNTFPIMPTEHEDSPVDRSATWGAIAEELGGFTRQLLHEDDVSPQSHLAMLAITGPSYVDRYFGSQIAGHNSTSSHGLMVLKHVGLTSRDNWLVDVNMPEDIKHLSTM